MVKQYIDEMQIWKTSINIFNLEKYSLNQQFLTGKGITMAE